MGNVLESKVQKDIIDYLESKGCYVVKITRANRAGTPDLLVSVPHPRATNDGWFPSIFVAIEVKAVGKKHTLTPLQAHHLKLIKSTGGYAFVADSVLDVELELAL